MRTVTTSSRDSAEPDAPFWLWPGQCSQPSPVSLALAGHPHLPWARPESSVLLGTPTQNLT